MSDPIKKSKTQAQCICGLKKWFTFTGLCSRETVNEALFEDGWDIDKRDGLNTFICPNCIKKTADITK